MTFEALVEDVLSGGRRRRNGKPVFTATAGPATDGEIARAEIRLGVKLPASYRWFARRAGAGEWCDEYVPAPGELYAFDEDVGAEMVGMIALVWNADGTGDYVAFRPAEAAASDEPPLYLCSHDPFGCNRAAASFAAWATGLLDANDAGAYFYESAYAEMDAKLAAERHARNGAKRWWEFWK